MTTTLISLLRHAVACARRAVCTGSFRFAIAVGIATAIATSRMPPRRSRCASRAAAPTCC